MLVTTTKPLILDQDALPPAEIDCAQTEWSTLTSLRCSLEGVAKFGSDSVYCVESSRELLSHVTSALQAIEALWYECGNVCQEDSFHRICASADLLSGWLLNAVVPHVQKLERGMTEGLFPTWNTLLTSTMSIARWNARWSWLRYKQPSIRFWTMASYLYEVAERWSKEQKNRSLVNDQGLSVSTEREYVRLLFGQWVAPASLSPAAQFLMETLLAGCMGNLRIASLADAGTQEQLDLCSGLIVLQTAHNIPRDRVRYISLSPLRDQVCTKLSDLIASGQVQADSASELFRTVVGRRTRYLVRMGRRTETMRMARACVGYQRILGSVHGKPSAASHAAIFESLAWSDCLVLDRSVDGCRLSLPKHADNALCVGALVGLNNVYDNEYCVGMVRWLRRTDADGWEAGVWMMRGQISVQRMRVDGGVWPSQNISEVVITVVDASKTSMHQVLAILPKHSSRAIKKIDAETHNVQYTVRLCLHPGADFDLVILDQMEPTIYKLSPAESLPH
ncbi:hypothetical protein [Cupriavidus sp. D39]|uniref:hypothetical protein n=1 Tax=Cupriavidus sp. D39 TaxID=2997877 RepID=UPI00226E734B|nr:hypothetical protein [Cupriavidus sp. D39]MCY0858766.1 hypothetical protein [Cupriavidus sp. D39]